MCGPGVGTRRVQSTRTLVHHARRATCTQARSVRVNALHTYFVFDLGFHKNYVGILRAPWLRAAATDTLKIDKRFGSARSAETLKNTVNWDNHRRRCSHVGQEPPALQSLWTASARAASAQGQPALCVTP